ncbi:MAG TPA: hypothetical protein DCS67_08475, partial [Clostridiales bacterium UBA8960]|nr:hypothetical protein [Clostridiales bacterium UBA8960]
MKKTMIIGLSLLIIMLVATACTKKANDTETTTVLTEVVDTMAEKEAIRIANVFFDDYVAGNYKDAYANPFDAAMKAGFPESVMKSVADQIEKNYGVFIEKRGEKTGYTQGYFIVTIGGVHEKKALAYNVVFNKETEIAGFNYNEISDIDTFFSTAVISDKEFEVTFGSEAFPLVGTLLYPEGERDFPVVILV